MRARFASANFYVNGVNIYDQIAPFLKSVKYSDSLEGESDTAEITLEDSQHRLLHNYAPVRGTAIRVELVKTSWNSRAWTENLPEEILPLGVFEVDEINDSYPPSQCVIKLNSIPNSAKIRGINQDKSWEQVNLSKIANDIASDAGLELFYDTSDDPQVERIEQAQESNLQFLSKLCRDNGLNLKVADGKIIIFDAQKYEAKAPVFQLNFGETVIKHFSGSATINGLYSDASIFYQSNGIMDALFGMLGTLDVINASSGLNLSSLGDLVNGAGSGVLKINRKVSSEREAERLAKKALREKNKNEIKVEFDLMGSFSFCAGNVFVLKDFGFYDGNYIVDRSDHELSAAGYSTKISAHKCLTGY